MDKQSMAGRPGLAGLSTVGDGVCMFGGGHSHVCMPAMQGWVLDWAGHARLTEAGRVRMGNVCVWGGEGGEGGRGGRKRQHGTCTQCKADVGEWVLDRDWW